MKAYMLLVRNPEVKPPTGHYRRRWVDNINMHLGDGRWVDMDCICLAQRKENWRVLVNVVINFLIS
jgi:hypothetical protein